MLQINLIVAVFAVHYRAYGAAAEGEESTNEETLPNHTTLISSSHDDYIYQVQTQNNKTTFAVRKLQSHRKHQFNLAFVCSSSCLDYIKRLYVQYIIK